MLEVAESIDLNSSADDVWNVIGNFGGLADWHPAAVACAVATAGDQSIRTINIPGGGTLVERLEAHDDEAMSQSYSIIDGPLPVANYRSTIKVLPAGAGSCKVHWSGQFDASGAPDDAARKIVRGIYTSGLSALADRFG